MDSVVAKVTFTCPNCGKDVTAESTALWTESDCMGYVELHCPCPECGQDVGIALF